MPRTTVKDPMAMDKNHMAMSKGYVVKDPMAMDKNHMAMAKDRVVKDPMAIYKDHVVMANNHKGEPNNHDGHSTYMIGCAHYESNFALDGQ